MLNPDLIILDMEMPYINGFEIYEKLKGLKTSFLLVSAHGDAYINTIAWSPEVKLLSKPFCKSDMSAILLSMKL